MDALGYHRYVVLRQRGVETAHAIQVTRQHGVGERACIVKVRLVFVAATQTVEGGNGGDQLHGRCRAHQLAGLILIKDGVGIEVENHQPDLCGFKEWVAQQRVELDAQTVFLSLSGYRKTAYQGKKQYFLHNRLQNYNFLSEK